eukprot:gene1801-3493_t
MKSNRFAIQVILLFGSLLSGFVIHAFQPVSSLPNIPALKMSSIPIGSVVREPVPKTSTLNEKINMWPCGDDLDKRIIGLAMPAILNFAVIPLVGAVDTFWVGRMSNALALAGQGAANQIFSSLFFISSFLPSVVTPLIAAAVGAGDSESVRKRVGEAVFIASLLGIFGSVCLYGFPHKALSLVLSPGAPALQYAQPYLSFRALTFLPALISSVYFAIFRGTMDFVTPLKISIIANIINVILDPILIFKAGMGVSGAAVATCVAELIAFLLYFREMIKKDLIRMTEIIRIPSFTELKPLLLGGMTIQMRAMALNVAILAGWRSVHRIDSTGVTAAAHAIATQFWQLGCIAIIALSTVATPVLSSVATDVPGSTDVELTATRQLMTKRASDRLMLWGLLLGIVSALVQLACLPILKFFSPLESVVSAARLPSIIGAFMNMINGVIFIGEGIQLGNQKFKELSVVTAIAAVCMLTSLKIFGKSLAGVWLSIGVLNIIRLAGVLRYHFFTSHLANVNKEITSV